ncbi:MAG: MarR family transcriptional regulator [Chloroflexi bacterium]|nr:MarR family transcriptional regulator [Chloroflexota bacterium]
MVTRDAVEPPPGREALTEALLTCQRDFPRFVQQLACQYAAPTALSLVQLRLLSELCRRGPLHVSVLADELQVSLPTMTQSINRLEARGWVRRRRAQSDRRSVDVVISTAGQAIYQAAHREVIRHLDERLGRLSTEECEAIARALPALERLVRG